jgi:hypothetical protein
MGVWTINHEFERQIIFIFQEMGQIHFGPGSSVWGALCSVHLDVTKSEGQWNPGDRVSLLWSAVRFFAGQYRIKRIGVVVTLYTHILERLGADW